MIGGQDLPPDYSFGGWEGHADEERLAALQATPAQRLAWLEQALAWVHAYAGALSGRDDEDQPH